MTSYFKSTKMTIVAKNDEQININVNINLLNKFNNFRHENARSFLLQTIYHTQFIYRF